MESVTQKGRVARGERWHKKAKRSVATGRKVCTKCGEDKPLEEFHREKSRVDGHASLCKACKKLSTEKWRRAHPDKVKAHRRRSTEEKRRRNVQRAHIEYPEFKHCGTCNTTKPLSEWHKSRRENDGLSSRCRACNSAYNKQRYRNDPSHSLKVAEAYRKKQIAERDAYLAGEIDAAPKSLHWHIGVYGLSLAEFQEINAKQNGRCAICGSLPEEAKGHRSKRLYIDHCHETGVVRGLLCSRCNSAIGYFDHNPTLMTNAAQYVTGASSCQPIASSA